MKRILFIFAKMKHSIQYVQGMNEVLAPLYYVFKTDPDEGNAVRNVIHGELHMPEFVSGKQ